MTSAFPFEGSIYTLKTCISGPKGMDKQMARKHMQSLIFKSGNLKCITSSNETEEYCKNLFGPKRLSTYYEDGEGGTVTYFGKPCQSKLDDDSLCLAYSKCIFKGIMFHSIYYKRTKKTDDSIVELESGEFARIIEILKYNDQCILRLSLIHVFCDNPFPEVVHIKKIRCEDNNPDQCLTVSILNIKRKVLLVSVTTARYLCVLPNTVEIQ